MAKRLKRLTLQATPEQMDRMIATLAENIGLQGLRVVIDVDKIRERRMRVWDDGLETD